MGRNSTLHGGTVDHNDLENRDIADQHDTGSITGLDTTLAEVTSDSESKKSKIGGFENRDDVTVSLDFGTGVLSVIPVGADFVVWSEGNTFTFDSTQTVIIP